MRCSNSQKHPLVIIRSNHSAHCSNVDFFGNFSFHESVDAQILVMTPRGSDICSNVLKHSVLHGFLGDFAI
eukprot:1662395-Prymnesium_polylepis.1